MSIKSLTEEFNLVSGVRLRKFSWANPAKYFEILDICSLRKQVIGVNESGVFSVVDLNSSGWVLHYEGNDFYRV